MAESSGTQPPEQQRHCHLSTCVTASSVDNSGTHDWSQRNLLKRNRILRIDRKERPTLPRLPGGGVRS